MITTRQQIAQRQQSAHHDGARADPRRITLRPHRQTTTVSATDPSCDENVSTHHSPGDPADRFITPSELAEHAGRESAWLSIKQQVYDVTEFVARHPGGDVLLAYAGGDATDPWTAFHSVSAYKHLPELFIGHLADTEGSAQAQAYRSDWMAMRAALRRQRAFVASWRFYVGRVLGILALFSLSCTLLYGMSYQRRYVYVMASSVCMALFLQQCGWLAHDFLHHQVFPQRWANDAAGLVVGNLCQGFSVTWWKRKHNHHHALPNVATDERIGGDPDIQTMPLLLWSEHLLESDLGFLRSAVAAAATASRWSAWLLRHQWWLYVPILCAARLSWLLQSIRFQLSSVHGDVRIPCAMRWLEPLSLAAHHVVVAILTRWICTLPGGSYGAAAVWLVSVQCLGGLLIGVVFTTGHNALHVLTPAERQRLDFVQLQCHTTRNTTSSWFWDWFCGGLNYQIEHHVWPQLPRHSLPLASQLLRRFCAKYGITYQTESFWAANRQVIRHLYQLSRLADQP
ncbi:hypothetical protein CDCA_CDCA08G2521 [Cyanidium caldarium]|uniref:Cytochrome b5 heme-binding domain-containing protein n=1 Tax=Cyanidium caldarium TaxID=2771 RepID=A0AAV9IWG1_CYACA|nr:hypothetical protein CDCA_CDCA08G2521 [Cyanidium caldarium]